MTRHDETEQRQLSQWKTAHNMTNQGSAKTMTLPQRNAMYVSIEKLKQLEQLKLESEALN